MKYLLKCILTAFILLPNIHFGQMILVTKDRHVSLVDSIKVYEGYIQYQEAESQVSMYLPRDEVYYFEAYRGSLNDYRNPKIFEGQKKLTIKFSLTGLEGESIITSFETLLNPRMIAEASVKLHTRSFNDYYFEEINGWGFEAGVKWKLSNPHRFGNNNKIKHLMSGLYLKPLIGYSSREEISYEGNNTYSILYGGINFGYQFVISNTLVIDLYVGGVGYTGSGSSIPMHGQFNIPRRIEPNEGDLIGKNNFARTFGIKLGLLIGT